ncbi:DUF2752 domain-containing protein [Luteolibacter algae]|uniref:DUF2752 domain-containing protein n=1 Tax=Luteolibacter algae TaxID=454151 RepID=A0ABW5D6R9_9BACT
MVYKGRILVLICVILGLVLAAYALRETGGAGWMPGCFFRKATGFDCPGCGMTRGTYAFLNGRFLEGFLFNPVGIVLLPLGMIGVGLEVIGWARGKPLPVRLSPGRWGAGIIAGIVITWWIARNIWW